MTCLLKFFIICTSYNSLLDATYKVINVTLKDCKQINKLIGISVICDKSVVLFIKLLLCSSFPNALNVYDFLTGAFRCCGEN